MTTQQVPMRTYQTICLTKVDMPDEKYDALIEKTRETLSSIGKGELLSTDDWGRAKISYNINKDSRARWTYFRFRSNADGLNELRRSLKLNEFVLREQTTLATEEGTDYNTIKASMATDLADRERLRERFKERRGDRPSFGARRGPRQRGNEGALGQSGDRGPSDRGPSDRGPSDRGPRNFERKPYDNTANASGDSSTPAAEIKTEGSEQ